MCKSFNTILNLNILGDGNGCIIIINEYLKCLMKLWSF